MEISVSKGYIVLAQNTADVDYVKQAYVLALSIHATQSETAISIVTNDNVPEEYQDVFDQIIPIPWIDSTPESRYVAEHRWKIYHVTPYDETIVLDTDMLMLEDINDWWWYCQDHDLLFCSQVLDYKGDIINNSVYRKTFVANKLPSPYFALHYFKKSEQAEYFYKVLEFVVNNWAWCYGKLAKEHYQDWLSMDLAAAIALELCGYNDRADICSPLRFVHMKPAVQGWHPIPAKWQNTVPYSFTKSGQLTVGNIKQPYLFHYVEKDFIGIDIIKKLKRLADGN
jgi:hypothetical protein